MTIYFKLKTGEEYYFKNIQKLRDIIYNKEKIHYPSLIMGIESYYGNIEYLRLSNVRII